MAAYDHVVLAQLWGDMRALPRVDPALHPRAAPALGGRRLAAAAAAPAGPARRAGRRPAQPGALERRWRDSRLASGAADRRRADRVVRMRIGVLTGGGDCPGLNAVIRAVVRKGVGVYGHEFVGFRDGWKGPLENVTMPLGVPEVRGILPRGGTILGSSRTNPFAVDGGVERIRREPALARASTR